MIRRLRDKRRREIVDRQHRCKRRFRRHQLLRAGRLQLAHHRRHRGVGVATLVELVRKRGLDRDQRLQHARLALIHTRRAARLIQQHHQRRAPVLFIVHHARPDRASAPRRNRLHVAHVAHHVLQPHVLQRAKLRLAHLHARRRQQRHARPFRVVPVDLFKHAAHPRAPPEHQQPRRLLLLLLPLSILLPQLLLLRHQHLLLVSHLRGCRAARFFTFRRLCDDRHAWLIRREEHDLVVL
mmetsp:Transcript_2099/g.4674  ORF Transcript_2099/g.4674 Transcript_2099/m.4674 type:complete len:239 (+) Transcript_2099:261-977(+)